MHPPIPRPRTLLALVALIGLGAGCGGGMFFVGPMPGGGRPIRSAHAVVEVDKAWRQASDVPHVSVFYDALAPYGVWEEDTALGWLWTPSDKNFAPYSRGRWVETEAGPTFLADEPFGWAVAHYGRWVFRDEGVASRVAGRWSWLPGTRWGPAWVAWRVGDDYVGWRALPPAGWSRPLPDSAWLFVPAREFIGPSVTDRAYGLRDVPWLVASSRPHEQEAPGASFVVGPEVRFAGWRARKIALGRLPAAQLRWVPRWERAEVRPGKRSVRVGPDRAERRARSAIAGPPSH